MIYEINESVRLMKLIDYKNVGKKNIIHEPYKTQLYFRRIAFYGHFFNVAQFRLLFLFEKIYNTIFYFS